MAQGDPYARMIEIMKRQGKYYNGYEMALAQVTGVAPVTIAVNGLPVAEHIYCNQLINSDEDGNLAAILEAEEYITPALKSFLQELYQELRVHPGDQVLVQRAGNNFFICGKVVPV